MNLNLSLNKEDFLEYHLFTASRSKTIIKQKRKNFIWVFAAIIIFGFNLYNNSDNGLIYFIPACIIILIGIYFLQKWQYKSYYNKFIKENYKEKIGLKTNLIFENDELITKNSIAESKINYNSFKEISEIKDYYFLKLKTEESFIIPKNKIENQEEFNKFISLMKTKYNVEEYVNLNWKH
ncbi:YcxB family protein [Chryseobacterium sp.]|uniref:YcxB family protein n=1 Tax=Chryseobacterium sp. TaxID=1871047 RepID=UPI0028A0DC64|nr:YcxB family protein [Chryseobacterium sp.]